MACVAEPKFNTTAKRCALVSAAMAAQAKVVRGVAGRESDPLVTYLWAEMLELLKSGGLELPPNTMRVFADVDGTGAFDPAVKDLLQPGDGAYYHVQMESPYKMGQLTEMVPPDPRRHTPLPRPMPLFRACSFALPRFAGAAISLLP